MSVREVGEPLRRWAAEGRRAGLATLVRVRGSAPRPAGARFAVCETGELAGSVSSGCVEGDLYEHLRRILAGAPAAVLEYGITDEMALEVGLACGGRIDVLAAPHDPDDPAWPALRRVVEEGEGAILLVGLSGPIRARHLLLLPDGSRVGSLGIRGLDGRAAAAAEELWGVEGTRILRLEAGSPLEVFAESILPPPRLAIVGATPVARALCGLAAAIGYAVTIVDPRTAFARPDGFPAAERLVHAWPEEGLREAAVDEWTSVVVLAHDRKLDVPALAAALRAGCRYVGQIGGRRTQTIRREALAEMGLPEEEVARIRGPVGLDIGAVTPEEIAVSILAELVAVRRGREDAG